MTFIIIFGIILILILSGYLIYYLSLKSIFIETLTNSDVPLSEAKTLWKENRFRILSYPIRRNKDD